MSANKNRFAAGLATVLLLAAALPLFSQSRTVPAPPSKEPSAITPPLVVDGAIEAMKSGEFLWAPEIAPEGPVTVIISLKTQRAYAYRNGVPIGVSTVSTGKPGKETPTGVFTILQKAVKHRSNIYSNAPMPFMQRLTWGGIAMHAGNLPGYPASHGCVRLPAEFAKLLFGVTSLGLTVVITNDPLAPEVAPAPTFLEPQKTSENSTKQGYRWRPEKSPSGPLSIVLSGRDKRIVVLRNGIEIGSSAIQIDGPVTETMAFTLRTIDASGYHWLRLPLPGQTPGAAGELTQIERARVHMPEPFRIVVAEALEPGTTLLVTRESLASGGTGKRMTILTTDEK
jgi:L,D-transpeptidase catalytic domain